MSEKMHITVCMTDEHSDYEEDLPALHSVCPNCRGKGTHVNRAIDGNGITSDEMAELGPDFFEDYMSGVYDVACDECKGLRVVLVPDYDKWTVEQREAHERNEKDLADMHAEMEAERRMGA